MSNSIAKIIRNQNHLQQSLHGMALGALLCTSALVAVKPAYANNESVDEHTVLAMYSGKTSETKAIQMDSDSLYKLALQFIDGEGLPKNEAYGISLLKQSAERGHTKAQYTLGVIHAQEGEESIALNWLTKAADKGHEDAQFVYKQILNSDFSIGC